MAQRRNELVYLYSICIFQQFFGVRKWEEKIVVLGTGGTIAGVAWAGAGSLDYRAAQWGIEQLLATVPGLRETAGCSVQSEQIAQLDSKDMDLDMAPAGAALRRTAGRSAGARPGDYPRHGHA